jgi:hypothetical protein
MGVLGERGCRLIHLVIDIADLPRVIKEARVLLGRGLGGCVHWL